MNIEIAHTKVPETPKQTHEMPVSEAAADAVWATLRLKRSESRAAQ